jgi:RNA polymerase sigma-70 factor (ECF subfamily)
MNEADAIAQMKSGNIAGLKALIQIYQVRAVQAAALITQDRAAAEDVVQNAFLRSYERIEQFDTSRPFHPWFLRMVINDALKVAGRQRRHVSLDAEEDGTYQKLIDKLNATTDEPEDIVQRNELREAITEALRKLSPRQRAVIVQRYYLGLSEREMSDELDCAPGTVKWNLNSARERLRALLMPFVK